MCSSWVFSFSSLKMAQARNMTPQQRKQYHGWSKEDLVWINPGGNPNCIINLFFLFNHNRYVIFI